MNKSNYFIFMDESGVTFEEKYFALGLLFVPTTLVGKLYDDMKVYYDKAKDVARNIKNKKIDELVEVKELETLKSITKSNINFELKFKNINFTNKEIYRDVINQYFKYIGVKFCSLIIDKNNGKEEFNPWELYINRTAMLVVNNIKHNPASKFILVSDHITKPKTVSESFETSLNKSIEVRLRKLDLDNPLVGILRFESHSSIMLQLVDILLGSVTFHFKENQGLISPKSSDKKGYVANFLKQKLNNANMIEDFTVNSPSYFSVWKYDEKKD